MTEDEVVGGHHRLNGREFEQAPEDGEGQRSLQHCSLWGRKESDTTERLNNSTEGRGASMCALVPRGCCNRPHRLLLIMVLEAGSPGSGCQHG